MAFPEINYGRDTASGYPGMMANTEHKEIATGILIDRESVGTGNGDVILPFGHLVLSAGLAGNPVNGSPLDRRNVVRPAGLVALAAGLVEGVAIMDRTLPHSHGGAYRDNDLVNIMRRGVIWVTVKGNGQAIAHEGNVTVGADGAFDAAGTFILEGATWYEGIPAVTAGETALIRLRLESKLRLVAAQV